MMPAHQRLILTVLAILVAGVCYERHLLADDATQLIVLQAETGKLELQLAEKIHDRLAIENELAATTQDFDTLQATEDAASTGREAELRSWLRQTSQIKELFSRRPDQAVPELSLFSPLDWLGVGHEANLNSEIEVRQSLSDARDRAKWQLQPLLSDALGEYTKAHGGLLPAAVSELAPYLDGAVDPAVLGGYEMKASGNIDDLPQQHVVIADSSPVDRDLDHRILILADGSRVTPWSQAPLDDAVSNAMDDYSKAHGGKAAGNPNTAQIAPYIQLPAIREIYQGLAEFAQSHAGRRTPTEAAELMPYLTTPEARAQAESLWPKRD